MYNALDIALPEMFATLIVWLHELFAALISSCTNCFKILKIHEFLMARRFDVLQYVECSYNNFIDYIELFPQSLQHVR